MKNLLPPPGSGSNNAGDDGNLSVMSYLHHLSGQEKEQKSAVYSEHNYSKCWNVHPDPNIKSRPAKFLFMANFPKHFFRGQRGEGDILDVDGTGSESSNQPDLNPILLESQSLSAAKPTAAGYPLQVDTTEAEYSEHPPPNKSGWSMTMNRLWNKSLKILQAERLSKLAFEGLPNEIILRRNMLERCCSKFRHLFTSSAMWSPSILSWLHTTLTEHVSQSYLVSYHETMQCLRQRLPLLVDRFYIYPKAETGMTRTKPNVSDPIMAVLNNHKPRRIVGSPLFLIIPNGPQVPHVFTSQRMKHWHSLFGSLGKVITVTVIHKRSMRTADCLHEIRLAVRDKIKECRSTFNETRPLVLVGFGPSSLIAAHCALNNAPQIKATICLGFPLTGVNGFRGDLDDPLLETTVPTLFVIGQNSTMSTLDDMEDFRERIVRTETGLVVIGGANDRLMVCSAKKRCAGITQAMVDRCVADEIHDFVSHVINPNHVSADYQSNAASASPSPAKKEPRKNSESRKNSDGSKKSTKKHSESKAALKRKKTAQLRAEVEAKAARMTEEQIVNPIAGAIGISPMSIDKRKVLDRPAPQSAALLPTLLTHDVAAGAIKTADEMQNTRTDVKPQADLPTPCGHDSAISADNHERHYGGSYGVSELPTVISSGTTRTRHIRAPKQLDM